MVGSRRLAHRPHNNSRFSTKLFFFWPLPTSRARQERRRRASGVRWWSERTNGPVVCAEGGADFISMQNKENLSILATFDTTPRHLSTGDSTDPLFYFRPLPTSRARQERRRRASGVWWWSERTNGPVVCAEGGADFISMQNKENLSILASFDTTPRHLHTGDSMDLPALIWHWGCRYVGTIGVTICQSLLSSTQIQLHCWIDVVTYPQTTYT
jgi:hypothetical protein